MEGQVAGLFEQFEAAVRQFTLYLATGVEGLAGLVVGFAVLETCWRGLGLVVRRSGHASSEETTEPVRLRLGHWLSVALELLLAADILKTAVAPTWDDIGRLAAIAAIRTALNYFLDREVREEERRTEERREATAAASLRQREE